MSTDSLAAAGSLSLSETCDRTDELEARRGRPGSAGSPGRLEDELDEVAPRRHGRRWAARGDEALEYLHYHIEPPIVHRDIKPSNILLDEDMVAHVSDFGLAKIVKVEASGQYLGETSSVGIKGTIGYLAPEYGAGAEVSVEGDVHSYGVLLLEILTGRRPTDALFDGTTSLPKFVEMAYPDKLLGIVDATIPRCGDTQEMIDLFIAPVARLGLACCRDSASHRMRMDEVVKELVAVKKAWAAHLSNIL